MDDAELAIKLDKTYEKAYIRKTSALESLKLKRAQSIDDTQCPVLECYRNGLNCLPKSKLLQDAIKISFTWITDRDIAILSGDDLSNLNISSNNNNKSQSVTNTSSSSSATSTKKKKISGPTKAQRESCEILDIRGALGVHELKVNGVYIPTDEIIGLFN